MATKTYRLYCEFCGWKKITDGSDVDKIYEYKQSKIQGNIPKIDLETQKLEEEIKYKPRPKKFRCEKCGRAVSPKQISNPQGVIDHKLEQEKRKKEWENRRSEWRI